MNALEISGLEKDFGGTKIIRGVSLDIRNGERHAIIGPNGAGKSTVFNLISGMFAPTSGSIRLNGREIAGLPPHKINRMGLSRSFQITSIFPRLTVFENVRIGVMARYDRRFGVFSLASRETEMNRITDDLIDFVRLGPVRDAMAGDLTYSEQRSLEIGMTLAPGGDVILLDEPTAGMSGDDARYIVELIRRVTDGKTLLVIEHDMDIVFSLSDRVSVLVYGEVIATGTPEAIRDDARVQEAYLGTEVA